MARLLSANVNGLGLAGRLRPVAVALVEPLLLVGQVQRASFHVRGDDARAHVEDVAVGQDERGVLAGLERADAVRDAETAFSRGKPNATEAAARCGRLRTFEPSFPPSLKRTRTPALSSRPAPANR